MNWSLKKKMKHIIKIIVSILRKQYQINIFIHIGYEELTLFLSYLSLQQQQQKKLFFFSFFSQVIFNLKVNFP